MERRGLTVTRERVNEIFGAFLGVDESGAAAGVRAVPAGQGAVLALRGRLSQRVCRGCGKACCVSLKPLAGLRLLCILR